METVDRQNDFRNTAEDWAEVVSFRVDNSRWFGPGDGDLHAIENASDQLSLLRLFLGVAVDRVIQNGQSPDDAAARSLVEKAGACADAITCAFRMPPRNVSLAEARRLFRMTWSVEPGNLIHETQNYGPLEVSRDDLERGVSQYLRSDFKDSRIDRYLVRALADMELSSFLWTQIGPDVPLLKSPLKIMHESVLMEWFKKTLAGLAVAIVACVAMVALKIYFPASPDWLVLSGLFLFAGGFVVLTTISSVALMVHGPKIAGERKRRIDTMRAAVDFYTEFHRPGTISLPHFRRCLEEARQKEIVWPQSLWSLLDDMDLRQVRAF